MGEAGHLDQARIQCRGRMAACEVCMCLLPGAPGAREVLPRAGVEVRQVDSGVQAAPENPPEWAGWGGRGMGEGGAG